MAVLTVREGGETLRDNQKILDFLAQFGIWFRHFEGSDKLDEDATEEAILAAYDAPIQELMAEGGYVTADVINIVPELEGLEAMLNQFNKEHWHDEDEIRFIVKGSGLFHLHPEGGPVFSIEVFKGDMLKVPQGALHWFDLCQDRTIRAIRLFKDKAGWTPRYTDSHKENAFQPLCFGPSHIPSTD